MKAVALHGHGGTEALKRQDADAAENVSRARIISAMAMRCRDTRFKANVRNKSASLSYSTGCGSKRK